MGIKVESVKHNLAEDLKKYADEWAHGDGVISRKDEKEEVQRWETDSKPEVVGKTAREVRGLEGKGSRVGLNDVKDYLLEKCEDLWEKHNQGNGAGKIYLSREEAERIKAESPELGNLIMKAWEASLKEYQSTIENGKYDKFVKNLDSIKISSIEDFKALTKEQQDHIVDYVGYNSHPDLIHIESTPLEKLTDAKEKEFAEKMKRFMEENSNLEIEDEYPQIGPVSEDVEFLKTADGEIVAGKIYYFQKGGHKEDGEWEYYYETEEKALADGVDVEADVSWGASGVFRHDGTAFDFDDHMEWSGW